MAELDAKTFDLMEALTGRSYPEDDFDIYLDEAGGYRLAKLNREAETLKPGSEEFLQNEEETKALIKRMQDHKLTVTIKGAPHHVRESVFESVEKMREDRDPAWEKELQYRTWATFIVKITNPSGEVIAPISREEAKALWDHLPDPARNTINAGIQTIAENSAAGFELAALDVDFLSDPSQEGKA